MKKKARLIRKLIRAYNNPRNNELSKTRGYPEDTYFGYPSLREFVVCCIKDYTQFYGNGLKMLDYE